MDGVRRRDEVDAPLEHLGTEHLLEAFEPLLVLQEAQQPEPDLRVVAELLDRDSEELRRAVDDDRADLGVEHPQLQAVEQDAGAARVVDHDVAVAEKVRELLDRRVEVAVPAVAIDVVVGRAEVVDGLLCPVSSGTRSQPGGHENEAAAWRPSSGAVTARCSSTSAGDVL